MIERQINLMIDTSIDPQREIDREREIERQIGA